MVEYAKDNGYLHLADDENQTDSKSMKKLKSINVIKSYSRIIWTNILQAQVHMYEGYHNCKKASCDKTCLLTRNGL